jgi:DNA-binding MarR family transcriptional regulator
MKNQEELVKMRELFLKIFNRLNQLEKTPRKYGTDELLYTSELLMIEGLGYKPGVNVTEYAENHGITKGAVSQLVKKLEKKGLVERYKNPTNQKEVFLKLTMKGEIVFHKHILLHLQFAKDFFDEFETLTPEQIGLIMHFLTTLDNLFDRAESMLDEMWNYT